MKLFDLKTYLKTTQIDNYFKNSKKRKTYDFWALSALCRVFNCDFTIIDSIKDIKTKQTFDLIEFHKLSNFYQKTKKMKKDIKPKNIIYFFKKLYPNVSVKKIMRQYKYAPEQKNIYFALRVV